MKDALLVKKKFMPIILVHEDNNLINRNIENLVYCNTPFITIEDDTNKYEI